MRVLYGIIVFFALFLLACSDAEREEKRLEGNLLMKGGKVICTQHGRHLQLAEELPMQKALEKHKDKNGRCFYELDYIEENWERVTLPHTFNDTDLFRDRIKDAGSGQKRTAVFYRNYLTVPKEYCGQKVLIEFEGIRQTCYLYVNGKMVGYVENGVAPFGYD